MESTGIDLIRVLSVHLILRLSSVRLPLIALVPLVCIAYVLSVVLHIYCFLCCGNYAVATNHTSGSPFPSYFALFVFRIELSFLLDTIQR